MVIVGKRGQRRLYRLEPIQLKPIHDWVGDYERYWNHQIDSIKECVEKKAMQRIEEENQPKRKSERKGK